MADTALAVAGPVLDILKDGLALVPIPGLGLIPQALSKVLEGIQVVRENSKSRKAFEDEAKRLGVVIQSISPNANDSVSANGGSQDRGSGDIAVRRVVHSPELQSGMNELLRSIEEIGTRTTSIKGGKISSFLHALHNRDVLQDMKADLAKATEDFKIKAHAAVDKGVQTIRLHSILRDLKCADAGYRSAHEEKSNLMEGTRKALLDEIVSWAQGEGPITEPVYALTGQAGMGKSAVGHRLCMLLDNSRTSTGTSRLSASFFFDCNRDNKLTSVRLLIPSIAGQLALSQPALTSYMFASFEEFAALGAGQLPSIAYDKLLKPLMDVKLSSIPPVVIIIDGLDECSDEEALCAALMQLGHLANAAPWLRLFVASRPEVRIIDVLQSLASSQVLHRRDLSNGDVLKAAGNDVKTFLVETILKIPRYKEYLANNDRPLKELVRMADALFIFARIAVNVLDSKTCRNNPKEGFRLVLSSTAPQLGKLDSLYLTILHSEFDPVELASSPCDHIQLLSLFTLICCAYGSRTPGRMVPFHNSLKQVASIRSRTAAKPGDKYAVKKEDIVNIVARLSSVLLINSDSAIVPVHATFTEFLLDPQRCTDTHYHIDEGAGHVALASACLAAFTRQTTVEILSAVRNGEQDVRGYGWYSAVACEGHIKAATYSDGFAQELEGALKQGHVLCHLRLLLYQGHGGISFYTSHFVVAVIDYCTRTTNPARHRSHRPPPPLSKAAVTVS
ncbi:AAA-16 domain-containing protein [Phanerochaete sordida]|uniref:AAA-16 domain-containing protein n=1 Tax=Phanerochaete sordida TaxID=48140 RepID=A0A9P3LCL9_9APHY|nr:AAA-16 domain-containing protein [Phanerochaete sordida]